MTTPVLSKPVRERINTYYCKSCGQYLKRESNKKWIKSICYRSGDKDVRLMLVDKYDPLFHAKALARTWNVAENIITRLKSNPKKQHLFIDGLVKTVKDSNL